MIIEQNISRLKYLMSSYRMSEDELVELASKNLKHKLTPEQLFSEQIALSHLKRIDKIFNKGLTYYVNPTNPIETEDASIFFRKTNFETDLNFGARRIVNYFEDLKTSLSGIATLSDFKVERSLPVYSLDSNPKVVADEVRSLLNPGFKRRKRDFLEALIASFARNNILVFEFVETWNKTHKANIDGFYIQPNVIVLKRQQKAFSREIFTLIHELGHYLLDIEEVEEVQYISSLNKDLSAVERWCNNFAFAFLMGNNNLQLTNLPSASISNDYHHDYVKNLSANTHLSRLSIYTHLFLREKISWNNYTKIRDALDVEWRENLKKEIAQKQKDDIMGIKREGRAPKPILSPLFIATLQSAFYEGVINEYDFCKTLNIPPQKFNTYIE